MTDSKNDYMSLRDAAAYAMVTPQAISFAIKKGAIKSEKVKILCRDGHLRECVGVTKAAIDEYRLYKFNREKRVKDGQRVYDLQEGRWSVLYAVKSLSASLNRHYSAPRLYYLLRIGEVKGYKSGGSWVIPKEEIVKLYERELAIQQRRQAQ